jgi:hypothetical protein
MANTELMSLLQFNEDELETNRQGRLSEMQEYRLRLRLRRSIAIGIGFILIMSLIATILIFLGSQEESPILTVIGVGVTICGAAITGVFARYWLRLNADIQQGKVSEVAGELERIVKPINRRVMTYLLRVDQAEFVVAKETFKVFKHGEAYRLYRAPYTGTLLSAEEI